MLEYGILPSAAEPSDRWRSDVPRRRFQKGSVVLQNGSWTGRYLEDFQIMENGVVRTVRKHKRVFLGSESELTKRMAERKFQPILDQINDGAGKPKTIITLNEFLVRWEPLGMPKTETARNFRSALNKYLKPAFGNVQLSEIGTERLQRFVSQTQTGASNMHNIVKCFRKIWKSAKAWGYVQTNPFTDLILPSVPKTEQRVFTIPELNLIVASAPEPDKSLYWILGQTGLRIGEVLALTWETLDLDKGLIRVVSSVARGRVREDVTKTQTSKRVIPISPDLINHLFTFRTNVWRENPLNLVFTNTKNKPWKADNLLKFRLQPLLERLGIPSAGFHAFRHTSASILEAMEASTKIRLERMGHTEESMTLRYTHLITDSARETAAKFDRFLLPERINNEKLLTDDTTCGRMVCS